MDGSPAVTADNWEGVNYKCYIEREGIDRAEPESDSLDQRCRSAKPFEYTILTQHTAQEAYDAILQQAGASLVRDAIDRRILEEVRNGSFTYGDKGLIDSQSQVGGWPELVSLPAPVDSDHDGMPDAWEEANGLDKHNAGDHSTYMLSPVYTHLEMYLNSFIK